MPFFNSPVVIINELYLPQLFTGASGKSTEVHPKRRAQSIAPLRRARHLADAPFGPMAASTSGRRVDHWVSGFLAQQSNAARLENAQVFNPYPTPPGKIDAGLNSYHHSIFQLVSRSHAQARGLVHRKTHSVSQPVAKSVA